MMIRLSPHLAVMRWELRRLGAIALAFGALDVLLAVIAWLGGWRIFWPTHFAFSAIVALLLGAVSVGSGIEEGNLEFLLVRSISRTGIWITSTLSGLLALLTFWFAVPFLLHNLGGPDAVPATSYGVYTGSRWRPESAASAQVMADSVPLLAFVALYSIAVAVAGVTRRQAAAIPVSALAGALSVVFADHAIGNTFLPEGSAVDALATALNVAQLDILWSGFFAGICIAGAAVSWASIWFHRDPVQRRRLAAGILFVGLVTLSGGGWVLLEHVTLSVTEAAMAAASRRDNDYIKWFVSGCPREDAVPALREALLMVDAGSPAEARLIWALHQYGEADGLAYARRRWEQIAAKGGRLMQEDARILNSLKPEEVDDATGGALFRLAERQAVALERTTPAGYEALVRLTSRLDRNRAADIWKASFDRRLRRIAEASGEITASDVKVLVELQPDRTAEATRTALFRLAAQRATEIAALLAGERLRAARKIATLRKITWLLDPERAAEAWVLAVGDPIAYETRKDNSPFTRKSYIEQLAPGLTRQALIVAKSTDLHWIVAAYPRMEAVPVLREALTKVATSSEAEQRIYSGLLQYGEPDGPTYFMTRWRRLVALGGHLTEQDIEPLSLIEASDIDEETGEALLQLAEREAAGLMAGRVTAQRAHNALGRLTLSLNKARAADFWSPVVDLMTKSSRIQELLVLLGPAHFSLMDSTWTPVEQHSGRSAACWART